MKYSVLLDDIKLLNQFSPAEIEEIIIPCAGFSREGGLAEDKAIELHHEATEKGFRTVLLADRLLEERHFHEFVERLSIWAQRTTVRVQDSGVAYWLKKKELNFQLSLEVGNANTLGIEGWLEILSPCVTKVVLNNQIPREHLLPILAKLEIPTEILGLGPILMYYTPRKLLSFQDIAEETVEATSDESGTKTFRFRESAAGTVMYFSKELCLVPHTEELDEAGLDYLRLDLRDSKPDQVSVAITSFKSGDTTELKSIWPYPLLTGYYKINKSDAIFKHLPKKRKEEEMLAVAEILDSSENQLLIRALQTITEGMQVLAVNTRNTETHWDIGNLKPLCSSDCGSVVDGDLLLIQKPAKFLPGTFIYKTP